MMRYQFHKESKSHAKKTKVGELTFDSKHEADRWFALRLLERGGYIKNLERQVRIELIPKSRFGRAIVYVADFVYEENGNKVIEDAKGVRTDVYRLKKRLVAERYGIVIRET